MIESSNGTLFKKIKIELVKNKKSKTVKEILKDSRPMKRKEKTFNFVFELDFTLNQKSYTLKGDGEGLNGDDCLWLPLANNDLECFEGNKVQNIEFPNKSTRFF